MTLDQAEAFINRLQSDDDFAARLEARKDSPEFVLELLQSEGFEATPDEIREVFLQHFGAQLDEEQLAAVAGGLSNEQIGNIVVGVGFGAAAIGVGAASAAAAA